MSTIKMVCPRDYTLRSTTGHTVKFEAGEPADVPEALYAEALAKNILPVKAGPGESPAFELATAEITGNLRDALVFDVIQVLVKRNNPEDFTGGGAPKAAAIARDTGLQISAREVSKYWNLYKQIVAENAEFPTHPNVELVRELQGMSTRKQMEEFAADIGVSVPKTKGKSLAEIKSELLYAIVNQKQSAPVADADDYVKPDSLEQD